MRRLGDKLVLLAGWMGWCALAAGGLALAGCQHQDLAERRWNERWARVGRTVDVANEREASNPERLGRTWKVIEKKIALDARRTGENADELNWYLRREFERWQKNQPEYRRWLENEFRGKPERIEENAIIMFF